MSKRDLIKSWEDLPSAKEARAKSNEGAARQSAWERHTLASKFEAAVAQAASKGETHATMTTEQMAVKTHIIAEFMNHLRRLGYTVKVWHGRWEVWW